MHLWCRLVWHRQCAKHHSTQSPRTEASLPWCHCIIVVNRLIVSTVLIVRWWFGLFPPMAFPSTTWYQNFLPLYGLKWGRPSQSSTRHKEKTGRCWGVGWTGWKVKDGRGQMRILMAWAWAFSFPQDVAWSQSKYTVTSAPWNIWEERLQFKNSVVWACYIIWTSRFLLKFPPRMIGCQESSVT